jgi:transcriptional regulator with XRE-family HTH domain
MVIVRVFVKKTQATPRREIELALARAGAGLTQQQVARRMKTTQAAVARMERGGSKPSMRTLERFARATGTRLRISFLPAAAKEPALSRAGRGG